MNIRKLVLAGVAVAALMGVPAQAAIVDNPQFRVLGLVIVWGADADGDAPMVSDFVVGVVGADASSDLIAGDVHTVVTGTLTPTPDALVSGDFEISDAVGAAGVLDATAGFSAFEIDDTTDVSVGTDYSLESSFYVASNTAFRIEADAVLDTAATTGDFDLSDIGMELTVDDGGAGTTDGTITFGAAARFPHTDNSDTGGVLAAVHPTAGGTLDDLDSVTIFEGDQSTAAAAGSIAAQSVRFDAVYTLGGDAGYDLSQGTGVIDAQVTYTVFVP